MICYLNGEFVADKDAKVSVFDRGFLFSDAAYEVSLVYEGHLVDNAGHLARLSRSLDKLGIKQPLSSEAIIDIQKQLIEKNNLHNAGIYLQITRGNAGFRDFLCPDGVEPTVLLAPQIIKIDDNPYAQRGISVISVPETRWLHRDIKTVGLLGAVLAKKVAVENGCDDAWFVENGYVTEASASNAYIIKDKAIISKAPNSQILNGITRQSVMRLAQEEGLDFIERDFTIDEAKQADEAFVSSATSLVIGVVKVDGVQIGEGKPGQLTQRLRAIYLENARANRLP